VLASFGFMGESKQINLTSMALKYLMPKYPNLFYLNCGEDKDGAVRKEYFNYPGIMDKVKVSGYIEGLESFVEYIAMSDIVINLRFPSAGETSGTMIRSMAQGKPVITYENPTLIDIPDNALVKIPLTDDSRQLISSLEKLIRDRNLRAEIGGHALHYAENELNMELNADKYLSAFEATRSLFNNCH
jgi:glycosyltransferase involved in cell wall biosynthesis